MSDAVRQGLYCECKKNCETLTKTGKPAGEERKDDVPDDPIL